MFALSISVVVLFLHRSLSQLVLALSISIVMLFLQSVAISASVCTQFSQIFTMLSTLSIWILRREPLEKGYVQQAVCLLHVSLCNTNYKSLYEAEVSSQMVTSSGKVANV